MTANPYDHFVGAANPVELIRDTPARFAAALARLGPARCDQPIAAGKWSPDQVIAHMADCELMHGVRLREALAEDNPVIRPFDQDAWAPRFAAYDQASAMDAFRAMRAWNLRLIESLTPADRARLLTHPERGSFPVEMLLRTMAGHDLNHLLVLEALDRPAV